MIFEITRSSSMCDEIKPCKEAFRKELQHWHTRTVTEEEFNKRFSGREGLWRDKDKNHKKLTPQYLERANGVWITRQTDDKDCWVLEINSLEELLTLEEECGPIILKERETYQDPKIGLVVKELRIDDDY